MQPGAEGEKGRGREERQRETHRETCCILNNGFPVVPWGGALTRKREEEQCTTSSSQGLRHTERWRLSGMCWKEAVQSTVPAGATGTCEQDQRLPQWWPGMVDAEWWPWPMESQRPEAVHVRGCLHALLPQPPRKSLQHGVFLEWGGYRWKPQKGWEFNVSPTGEDRNTLIFERWRDMFLLHSINGQIHICNYINSYKYIYVIYISLNILNRSQKSPGEGGTEIG